MAAICLCLSNLLHPVPKWLLICVLLMVSATGLFAQDKVPAGKVVVVERPYYLPAGREEVYEDSLAVDSTVKNKYYLPYTRQQGKGGYNSYVLPRQRVVVKSEPVAGKEFTGPDLVIHGNVLYSADYRSNLDTPYMEKDVYYHTIQTWLDVNYKNFYPFRVYLTSRFSNSSYLRRYTDVSMAFNASDFRTRIKQAVKNYRAPEWNADSLQYWQNDLQRRRLELAELKGWARSAATTQKLVEARERALYRGKDSLNIPDTSLDLSALQLSVNNRFSGVDRDKLPAYLKGLKGTKADSLNGRSDAGADSAFIQNYEKRKKRMDSLQAELKKAEVAYSGLMERWAAYKKNANQGIDQAGTVDDLQAEMKARNMPDSAMPAGYKTLWGIKSLGVGRTMVDYSELSAKNISINGFQVEYNPSYYTAVAIGTIDYRFRNLIVKDGTYPSQYLYLARAGRGMKNGNNIIFTWYSGKKQLYNTTGTTATATDQPDYHLMGFTLEGNYRITPVTYLTAEVAKSSLPYYTQSGTQKSLISGAVRFSERSNEAWSLKLQTLIKKTATRLSGFYKRYGANFQSFSVMNTGTEQKAWMVKADQPFFRQRLTVTASLKENDYANPATSVTYQSNLVYKSIQATLRLPKWPVLMVGYYPSSQLLKLSDDSYTESMFYTMVANMSYYYKAKTINMASTAMYTRFYNKQSDSGFVYANTTNFMFSQSLFFKKLTTQSTATLAFNGDYNLYTIDNEAQYSVLQWLTVGGGIKYNRQTTYNIDQFGYSGSVGLKIKKLGELQLMVDKGFIPGSNKTLVDNTTGRFSFLKIF